MLRAAFATASVAKKSLPVSLPAYAVAANIYSLKPRAIVFAESESGRDMCGLHRSPEASGGLSEKIRDRIPRQMGVHAMVCTCVWPGSLPIIGRLSLSARVASFTFRYYFNKGNYVLV